MKKTLGYLIADIRVELEQVSDIAATDGQDLNRCFGNRCEAENMRWHEGWPAKNAALADDYYQRWAG